MKYRIRDEKVIVFSGCCFHAGKCMRAVFISKRTSAIHLRVFQKNGTLFKQKFIYTFRQVVSAGYNGKCPQTKAQEEKR